jgi:hypothetical protein
MTNLPSPYIPVKPGDLITSDLFNTVQGDIKQDIASQIQTAVGGITKVASAGDSDKLGGQTPADLTDAIVKQVLAKIPEQTGYRMYFKRLTTGEEKVIEHKLGAAPLVDICRLQYFPAVCASGDQKTPTWVNFYIYHSSERRIRLAGPPAINIEIEPSEKFHPFRVPFTEMLDRYKVQYTDQTSLSELVTNFWNALFQSPNDEFDPDQYCHSPWFDRCCCVENASVKTVRDRGDLANIYVKWMPTRTVFYPTSTAPPFLVADPSPIELSENILVEHFDFNTLGLRLPQDPFYSTTVTPPAGFPPYNAAIINFKEVKVMVLLKV